MAESSIGLLRDDVRRSVDTDFGTAVDRSVWLLVGSAVEHVLETPVLFRLWPVLLGNEATPEIVVSTPGKQPAFA